MSAIRDEVRIEASAGQVYRALTEQAGYRGWWNAVAEVPAAVGEEAKLRFVKDGQPIHMTFRIAELTPDERVRWTCVAHDMPSWVGTSLAWRIAPAGGAVLVQLEHDGWHGQPPEPVAQGWRHFLGSLKSYVETGTGQPW
jgi:uncharacterized protein YndB with AHSA1/START domain